MTKSGPFKPMPLREVVDARYLAVLYLEHGPGLRRLAFGVLRDQQAAEDIVQATFAKAAATGDAIEPEGMKSWLYRVAFNEAVTWKRRSSVAEKAIPELAQRRKESGWEAPEDVLVRSETVQLVCEVIQSLAPEEQGVVRARVYQEKKFAQIAAEMGLPLGTVLTRMRQALEKMRRKLRKLKDDD